MCLCCAQAEGYATTPVPWAAVLPSSTSSFGWHLRALWLKSLIYLPSSPFTSSWIILLRFHWDLKVKRGCSIQHLLSLGRAPLHFCLNLSSSQNDRGGGGGLKGVGRKERYASSTSYMDQVGQVLRCSSPTCCLLFEEGKRGQKACWLKRVFEKSSGRREATWGRGVARRAPREPAGVECVFMCLSVRMSVRLPVCMSVCACDCAWARERKTEKMLDTIKH